MPYSEGKSLKKNPIWDFLLLLLLDTISFRAFWNQYWWNKKNPRIQMQIFWQLKYNYKYKTWYLLKHLSLKIIEYICYDMPYFRDDKQIL